MRKQDQLLKLIQSMSPSEKKHFVQSVRASGSDKSYLRLYESLLQAEHYDAEVLSKKLGKKKSDLANEKKYLEQMLLRALRGFHEQDVHIALLNAFSNNLILSKKKLFDFGSDKISRLKERADEHNLFAISSMFSKQKALMIQDEALLKSENFPASIFDSIAEGRKALKYEESIFDMMELNFRSYMLYNENGHSYNETLRKKIDKIQAHPFLKAKHSNVNFSLWQSNIIMILSLLGLDVDLSIIHSRHIVSILEKHPDVVQHKCDRYHAAINMLVNCYSIDKKHQLGYEQILAKVVNQAYRKTAFDTKQLDALFGQTTEMYKMLLILTKYRNGKIKEAAAGQYLKGLWPRIAQLSKEMSPGGYQTMLRNAAHLHLLLKQPADAVNYINIYLDTSGPDTFSESYAVTKLALVIAHQELGNYTILHSLVNSAKRLYKQRNLLTEVETETFAAITQLIKAPDKNQRTAIFKKLKATFQELEKNRKHYLRLQRFDLMDWVDRNM